MGLRLRKFYIGLISLGAVLVIYLLVGKTPDIDTNRPAELTQNIPDSNIGKVGRKVGTISRVGVGSIQKAEYTHLNKNKEVDRVFGFEKLLHIAADEWEIEKPYMNIFQRNFKCYITADKGRVQIETTVGRPSPKDATFTGNVVIHILPEKSSGIKESFVHLDDIVFVSERSLFTTTGQVKFVNEDVQMLGRGLELIYNGELERLEFLRIIHLESLHYKSSSKAALFSSEKTDVDSSSGTNSQVQTKSPSKPVAANAAQKAKAASTAGKQPSKQSEDRYYKCVFSKNVFINAPEQLVFTNRLSINNVFWPRNSGSTSSINQNQPYKTGSLKPDNAKKSDIAITPKNNPAKSSEKSADIVITCDNGVVVVPMSAAKTDIDLSTFGPVQSAPAGTYAPPEKLKKADGRTILVAQKIDYCASTKNAVTEGPLELTFYSKSVAAEPNEAVVPVTITAQKEARFLAAAKQAVFEGNCLCKVPRGEPNSRQDYTLSSPKLTVNLAKDKHKPSFTSADIFAAGPAELTFYVDMNDVGQKDTKKTVIPAKVSAKKEAKFLSASNQVIFEGDTLCTMLKDGPNIRQKYSLSAPRLTIDLPRNKSRSYSSASTAGIEHLTADGGLVRLSSIKTAGSSSRFAKETQNRNQGKLLGGIELKCVRFDYDTAQQLFLAAGPGVIKFYNSDTSKSDAALDGFSMQKPCWVFVEDFATLRYLSQSNLVIADAGPQGILLINYFPVNNNQPLYDQQVTATAGHIEAKLLETVAGAGRPELSTLTALGGITYEDKDKRFIGSELFYDYSNSVITVHGDELQPCLLNGAFVDTIEYDLKTGGVKAEVTGPGAFQRKR